MTSEVIVKLGKNLQNDSRFEMINFRIKHDVTNLIREPEMKPAPYTGIKNLFMLNVQIQFTQELTHLKF